jgi:chemotaxis protein histidine kinase CheA
VNEGEEIIQAFPVESREDLHTLERGLVELTRGAEDLLDALRSGTLVPDADITTSLVGLLDVLRPVLGRIQATGEEGGDSRDTIADPAAHVGHGSSDASRWSPPTTPRAAPDPPLVTGNLPPADDRPSAEIGEPSLLLATGAGGMHLAVSLSAVQRLEQFAPEQMLRSGDIDIIRYGDAILPLLRLADLLPGPGDERRHPQAPRAEHAQTIVCHSSAGSVGLVVESIEDVVPEPGFPSAPSGRPGVARRLVIAGRVTELLDVEALAVAAGHRVHWP